VRNPWGTDQFNGPWADGSSLWTDAFKAQIPTYVSNTKDGGFFIEDVNFVKAFYYYQIGFVHSTWNHSYYSKTSDTGAVGAYTFTLPSAQEVYIMGDLYDFRMYPTNCKYSYTSGSLSLLKGTTSVGSTTFSD